MRVACPSCSTKRSILFGENICELVRPISHLHVTFTFNHHPHVHALVPAGIMQEGVFHELKRVSPPVLAGLCRARLLKVLLDEGVISQQIVDLLLTWNHH
jgi:hypothetical protein